MYAFNLSHVIYQAVPTMDPKKWQFPLGNSWWEKEKKKPDSTQEELASCLKGFM